jgi:hypothetical protein
LKANARQTIAFLRGLEVTAIIRHGDVTPTARDKHAHRDAVPRSLEDRA